MRKKHLIQVVELVYELASVARREGLLALEEYICTCDAGKKSVLINRDGKRPLNGEEESFAIQLLSLMIDGYEKERINTLSENLIKGSHAYGIKKLFMIMFEPAVLNIQQGENPRYTAESVAAFLGTKAVSECKKIADEYDEKFRKEKNLCEQKLLEVLTEEVQNHIRKIDAVFAKKEAELESLVEKNLLAAKKVNDSDSSFYPCKSASGWLKFTAGDEDWNLYVVTIPESKDNLRNQNHSIRTKNGEIPVCESTHIIFEGVVHNRYDIESFMKLTSATTEEIEKEISFTIELSSNNHAYSLFV